MRSGTFKKLIPPPITPKLEGIDVPDGQVTIDDVAVETFQNSIHINDEDNRISGSSLLVNTSGTEGMYIGYYIALDFNRVTNDMSNVTEVYAKVKVNGEPAYEGTVNEDKYLLIQVASSFDTDLDDAVLTITAVNESGDVPVDVYKNEYALNGIQLVTPEPPETPRMEGITPDSNFSSQSITLDEEEKAIKGSVSLATVGDNSGYYISLDFSDITSDDMSEVSSIGYVASDVRMETVDSGVVADNKATILVAESDAVDILVQSIVIEAYDANNAVIYRNTYDTSAITLAE